MKTAFGIFTRDLRLLLRNPVALLVVGALLVLPGLYAWYCIIANWDPYSHTGSVPVAVVNEDRGAESDLTGAIDIGSQVVEQLRGNDSIEWHFVGDQMQALTDTRSGRYYATIVLPASLSADVVGIFSGSGAGPAIYYYPNEKYNAVATKVTDSAALTLVRQVNQAFASQVNEKILESVQTGVQSAEDAAGKTHDSASAELARVQGDIRGAISSLDDAIDSITAWRSAIAGGQEALAGTAGQLPAIRRALDSASGDLVTLRQKTAEFNAEFGSALLGSNQLVSSLSSRTSTRIADVGADVRQLSGGIGGLVEQLRELRELAEQAADLLPEGDLRDELLSTVAEVDATLANLEGASGDLAAAADSAATRAGEVNGSVQQAIDEADAANRTFTDEVLPRLSTGADSLSRSLGGLSGAIGQFEPQVGQLQDVLARADGALARAAGAIGREKALLEGVGEHLESAITDLGALGGALEVRELSELLDMSPDRVGQFISSPVNMITEKVYPVSNYGTAVAPFYTNLALWIGCFILISIIRLEVSRRGFEDATTTQRYFGRWLLLVLLAVLQSQVICGVDILLGIDCASPAAFLASGAICSFCYMNLIYALALTFRNIGKTLCILLLIMQIPGSSGMYPIEMMPGFFQAIHPFLPFTYGIDAMREALCGMYGGNLAGDWLVLSSLIPASLLLGLALRPRLLNLTQLFDVELDKTGFFAGEEHGQGAENDGIRRLMRALSHSDSYRDEVERRAWRFSSRYPRLRRGGSIALFAVPFAFLLIMLPFNLTHDMTVDVKLVSLVIILAVLLLVQAGLIVLEYMHRTISEETRLLGIELLDGYATVVDQADDARQAVDRHADEVRSEVLDAVEHRAEEAREAAQSYLAETIRSREAATSAPSLLATAAADAAAAGPSKRRGRHARDRRRRHGAAHDIFFTDLRLGFQSVIGVVVIMLLMITPSLYAWFNIAGSWDPYSKTDGLRVAVANEDAGYKGDLLPLTVNVGDTVVSQLRGNSSFDWQFVSHDEALEGIRAGEYYASIVIPEDFSRDMMTYLTDDADYPDITYYTNEKENPIAPLITQKGADSIEESIRVTFTERVDEVGLTLASDLLEYVGRPQVGTYVEKMGAHLDDAAGDLRFSADEMRSLSDLSGTAADIVQATGSAMDGVMAAAVAAKSSLSEAEKGVEDADAAFGQATALVGGLVSRNAGSLDRIAEDADAALAALQGPAAGTPAKLRQAQGRVAAWEGEMEKLHGVLLDAAGAPELDDGERRELEDAAAKVQAMADSLGRIQSALEQAARNSEGSVANIEDVRAELKDLLVEVKSSVDGARSFYDGDVKGAASDLRATMGTVSSSTHGIMSGLEGAVGGLSESTGGLSGQLLSLSDGLAGAASRLDSAAGLLSDGKARVADALASGDAQQMKGLLLGSDATVLATRLAAPVQEREEAIFPVENYGSSMAPFYTVLSLWVGALVMVSTMKVHLTPKRVEELQRRFRLKPRHEYFGRLGIFSFIALLQSLLVCLGDLCLLHIQCVHPVLFVLFGICIGQVFCLIVYTFTELFGDVGKAVCIILLVMQVAASGGTFPPEMLGRLFFDIVPFLPFYHGMTALQGCVAGIYYGDSFVYLAFLLVFVMGMLLMGLVARKPFRFVTDWVERQLEKTRFM